LADAITEDVAFSFNSNEGAQEVDGPQFNPVLGTLTSVSAIVSGTYAPNIFVYTSSPPASWTLMGEWSVPGKSVTSMLETYSPTVNGGVLAGPAQQFSFSTGAFPFPQNYVDVGGYPAFANGFLINVGVYSLPASAYSANDFNDDSSFSGDVQITYTYTVPEPSSLAMLAFGAELLPLAGFVRGVSRLHGARRAQRGSGG
jgi:hypothetical protein